MPRRTEGDVLRVRRCESGCKDLVVGLNRAVIALLEGKPAPVKLFQVGIVMAKRVDVDFPPFDRDLIWIMGEIEKEPIHRKWRVAETACTGDACNASYGGNFWLERTMGT